MIKMRDKIALLLSLPAPQKHVQCLPAQIWTVCLTQPDPLMAKAESNNDFSQPSLQMFTQRMADLFRKWGKFPQGRVFLIMTQVIPPSLIQTAAQLCPPLALIIMPLDSPQWNLGLNQWKTNIDVGSTRLLTGGFSLCVCWGSGSGCGCGEYGWCVGS